MLLIWKLKLSYLCLFVSAPEISENTFFTEHLWATASVPIILLFLLILNGFFDKVRLENEERHLKFFKLLYFFPKNCTKALWKIFLAKIRKVEGRALSFSQTSRVLYFVLTNVVWGSLNCHKKTLKEHIFPVDYILIKYHSWSKNVFHVDRHLDYLPLILGIKAFNG